MPDPADAINRRLGEHTYVYRVEALEEELKHCQNIGYSVEIKGDVFHRTGVGRHKEECKRTQRGAVCADVGM